MTAGTRRSSGALARAELVEYADVEVRDVAATFLQRLPDGTFCAHLVDGTAVGARTLVLATGVRDVLPEVPGLTRAVGQDRAHVSPL